jgi:hypothetical protein
MMFSTQPQPRPSSELLVFLQQKLGLSDNALELGLRQAELEQAPLPIVLWSFGLLSLLQYQEVLEWQRLQGQL